MNACRLGVQLSWPVERLGMGAAAQHRDGGWRWTDHSSSSVARMGAAGSDDSWAERGPKCLGTRQQFKAPIQRRLHCFEIGCRQAPRPYLIIRAWILAARSSGSHGW
jgi:hypothetical protein